MELTTEQVLALAPDASSAAAGKKLAGPKGWRGLGRSPAALWGECQGSALYQVRVDLGDLASKCSCPSRKFPCKHALGLLLIAAASPATLEEGEPPEWVRDWLDRRAATAERREPKAAQPATDAPAATPETSAARAKRTTDRRQSRALAGLDALDLWLDDLTRNGLASAETQPASFWEGQAARLVDAQLPGLAARLRRIAGIPNASRDWPARLLDELGRLALLSHAFRRLDALDPALQEDVRGAIGWTLGQEEVQARGDRVADQWLVLGQRVTTEDRLRAQWTWLLGREGGRYALLLQFAHGGQPFADPFIPGTVLDADLAFWPGANPQRALVVARRGVVNTFPGPPPGFPRIAAFLDHIATALAAQPWLDRFPCSLNDVVPVHGGEGPSLAVDAEGAALPLAGDEHWRLLAVSGGRPVDLLGEWDGRALLPLGVVAEGRYYPLTEAR